MLGLTSIKWIPVFTQQCWPSNQKQADVQQALELTSTQTTYGFKGKITRCKLKTLGTCQGYKMKYSSGPNKLKATN